MFKFIRSLIGGKPPVSINADPFGRDTAAPEPLPRTAGIAARTTPAVVIQRDEIIDARTRIAGYQLSARSSDPGQQLYSRATLEVLRESNVASMAERRVVLIPVSSDQWLSFDYRTLIGDRTVFLLELPTGPEQIERWSESAKSIRISGARVAIRGNEIEQNRNLIGEYADLVLNDFAASPLPLLEETIKRVKRDQPQLLVMIDNVSTWSQFRYCCAHNTDYCMGPFTISADDEVEVTEIGTSRLVLIEMLNLLRGDADLSDIAKVAKRDPGVAVKLVTMANSPLLGISKEITSIDQAIVMLGRDQLYRWLSMAMFRAGTGSPRDDVLLELALARGRFLELISQGRHSKAECDELFLVGLLSLLDSLLGVPMDELVAQLNLSETLNAVLLRSEGPFGRYLLLVMAVEKANAKIVALLSQQMAIPQADIEQATTASLLWAEEAAQMGRR